MYIKKLKIGNVELENNIILAPMAGITDLPFRIICKKYGVGLVCTEMASAKAIYYGDEKTKQLLDITEEKRPVSAQIFGSDIESMKVATKYINTFADILDINMGCPAPKVVKNGDGSKLLLDLELIEKIVTEVVKISKIPVTVKIRMGWDDEHIVAIDAAKIIQNAGASAITIHGRTRQDFFTGKCNLEIIKKVKENVNIPVIGNGDITDVEQAKKMFEETNVDGIMIGRGALGNPWIFKNILEYLKNGTLINPPTPKEKFEIIKQHIELEVKQKGENVGIKEMRKHIAWYTKNLKDSSNIRQQINTITKKDELLKTLKEYFYSI